MPGAFNRVTISIVGADVTGLVLEVETSGKVGLGCEQTT